LFRFHLQPTNQPKHEITDMNTTTTLLETACPECDAAITAAEAPFVHEILPCPDCGLELEVVSVEPIELLPAPEVEEDWGE